MRNDLDRLLPVDSSDRLNRIVRFYDEWGYVIPSLSGGPAEQVTQLVRELHETYRLNNLIRELEDEQLEMRLVANLAGWLL